MIKLQAFAVQHKIWLLVIFMGAVLIRFAYLNFINWDTGAISNAEPGLKIWLDSERYTEGAERLINRQGLIGREHQFTGYIGLIAITQIIRLPLYSMAIIQIIVALVASVALAHSVKLMSGSISAGLIASALFLCNPFITSWHIYIMTESLYTSFVIISFWSLARVVIHRKARDYILSALVLAITVSLRPNGWILIPIFTLSYILILGLAVRYKILIAALICGGFVVTAGSLSVVRNSIEITTPIDNLQRGITVWGHDELNLSMPQEPELSDAGWTAGYRYVLKHPLASMKLAAARAAYSIGHIRPYHSARYKLHVLLWILPAYLFSLFAVYHYRKNPLLWISLAFIGGHLLVIALSYAEHDSRFDIYILPMFYMLAAAGLAKLFVIPPTSIKSRGVETN